MGSGSRPAHELLKADTRGRIRISTERRAALLEEFDRSGISGAGFAKHYGIKYTTFAHWIRVRKVARRAGEKSTPFLLVASGSGPAPAHTPAPKARGVLVHLPNGASLTVMDTAEAELAGAVIRALGTRD